MVDDERPKRNPFFIQVIAQDRRATREEFIDTLRDDVHNCRKTPKEAEEEIAERNYREYVAIPLVTRLFDVCVFPFWRRGQKAPSLKDYYPRFHSSHHY